MDKNKLKGLDKKIGVKMDAQRWRLEQLISKFYPNGIRAESVYPYEAAEYVKGLPSLRRFAEDNEALSKCCKIMADVRKIDDGIKNNKLASTVINLFFYQQKYRTLTCTDSDICIMFKVAPDDAPIYLMADVLVEYLVPAFLIDGETGDAFLIIMDYDDQDINFEDEYYLDNSSFIRLSEFHAIVSGVKLYDIDHDELCFVTSFSKEERKYYVEIVFETNKSLLDQLFPLDESIEEADEPATCLNLQSESIPKASEHLPPVSYCNDSPPTVPNSDDIDDLPPPSNDTPLPKKRGRPAKMKSKVVEDDVTPSDT